MRDARRCAAEGVLCGCCASRYSSIFHESRTTVPPPDVGTVFPPERDASSLNRRDANRSEPLARSHACAPGEHAVAPATFLPPSSHSCQLPSSPRSGFLNSDCRRALMRGLLLASRAPRAHAGRGREILLRQIAAGAVPGEACSVNTVLRSAAPRTRSPCPGEQRVHW